MVVHGRDRVSLREAASRDVGREGHRVDVQLLEVTTSSHCRPRAATAYAVNQPFNARDKLRLSKAKGTNMRSMLALA